MSKIVERDEENDEDGASGIKNAHDSAASMVQDRLEVGDTQDTRANVPCKLNTLLVRRPGRVSAAMEFVENAIRVVGFGALGTGDTMGRDVTDGQRQIAAGEPCKEFVSTRAAALRVLESYFSGAINDELLVEAEFIVEGRPQSVKFAGQIDGETGRVTDPRYSPHELAGPAKVARVDKAPLCKITLSDGSTAMLPPGLTPERIESVGADRDMPNLLRLKLVTGNVLVIDRRTGTIIP